MLLLLQWVALLAVGLAAGHFHYRVGLLLEPVTAACGGADPAARMQVAEQLMARANALDDWQPLHWIPVAGVALALLGAMAICMHRLRWLDGRLRAACWGLMTLHAAALALAGRTLYLYESSWASVAMLSPTVCLVDLAEHGSMPLEQAQQVVFHILTRENAPLLRNPDDLALVLAVVLLAAMAAGVALWRAACRNAGWDS